MVQVPADIRAEQWDSFDPGLSVQGREMMLVLKRDTLTLLDPLDHTPLHSQPIINIRVWGVGCNNGRSVSPDPVFRSGILNRFNLRCVSLCLFTPSPPDPLTS